MFLYSTTKGTLGIAFIIILFIFFQRYGTIINKGLRNVVCCLKLCVSDEECGLQASCFYRILFIKCLMKYIDNFNIKQRIPLAKR